MEIIWIYQGHYLQVLNMFRNRYCKLRFGLSSVFILTLGIAIGFTLNKWAALLTIQRPQGLDFAGLGLSEEPQSTFANGQSRYRGGMRINRVSPNSPGAQAGILPGDILVGMHQWETATKKDVEYVRSQLNLGQMGKVKFYVLRGQNTLYGHLRVASN
jgi:hypothetical protein